MWGFQSPFHTYLYYARIQQGRSFHATKIGCLEHQPMKRLYLLNKAVDLCRTYKVYFYIAL